MSWTCLVSIVLRLYCGPSVGVGFGGQLPHLWMCLLGFLSSASFSGLLGSQKCSAPSTSHIVNQWDHRSATPIDIRLDIVSSLHSRYPYPTHHKTCLTVWLRACSPDQQLQTIHAIITLNQKLYSSHLSKNKALTSRIPMPRSQLGPFHFVPASVN